MGGHDIMGYNTGSVVVDDEVLEGIFSKSKETLNESGSQLKIEVKF